MLRSGWVALCAAGAMAAAGHAAASVDMFTLGNTNGGDGGVTLLSGGGFDLFGADNGTSRIFDHGPLSSLTTYTATSGGAQTLTFDWTYGSVDGEGSAFDPGGWILNGVQTQLSPNDLLFDSASGQLTLNLAAGDNYGFYIYSTDSQAGRGDIAVRPAQRLSAETLAAVPEPASWALMIGGFFGLGLALRRRRGAGPPSLTVIRGHPQASVRPSGVER